MIKFYAIWDPLTEEGLSLYKKSHLPKWEGYIDDYDLACNFQLFQFLADAKEAKLDLENRFLAQGDTTKFEILTLHSPFT